MLVDATGTAAADQAASARRDALVIRLLLVSAFVVILNETVMGVAIPHLMTDLGITAVAAQWLTTAFMLTMAVVIPVTGFLIQRFTTRAMFIAAMSLFTAGTAIAAAAPGYEVLLAGRIVQATGTAIIMPLLMTTVMSLVPPAQRGARMGNISIVISVAPAIGPTLSGLVLSVLSWRFMFVLVLPIAIASLVLGIRKLTNVGESSRTPIDPWSVALSALGFGGLVFGLSNIGESAAGGSMTPVAISLGVGAAALALFLWRQVVLARTDSALLDLRTFRSRTFAISVLMFVVSMMALFGTLILLPIYLQKVLGLTVLMSGLMMLPGGVLMGVLAPTVGRLYDRVGPRPLLVPGTIIVAGVMWVLAFVVGAATPWWVLLAAHVVLSLGLALVFTPLFTASLGSLPPKFYAYGSATVSTVQQVAGAAGTALFVAAMSATMLRRLGEGADQVTAQAEGIHSAFLIGAVIATIAVLTGAFVSRPEEPADGPPSDAPVLH